MINPFAEKPANTPKREHVPAQATRREIESLQLLGGGKELLIRHDGKCYTLRHTSKGKLILTK